MNNNIGSGDVLHKSVVCSVSSSLTSDDFIRLQSGWKGGCVFSTHDSVLADNWLNLHYEHECLMKLRANDIGGPIASMLSVDAPALTIFGPMSTQIIELASRLAELSDFPVIIRPASEDPSASFK